MQWAINNIRKLHTNTESDIISNMFGYLVYATFCLSYCLVKQQKTNGERICQWSVYIFVDVMNGLKCTRHLWYHIDQCSHLMYTRCIQEQTCEHFDSIGHRSCKIIIQEKAPLLHKLCAFSAWIRYLSYYVCMYLRGSHFLQCVILSTTLNCSLSRKFVCYQQFCFE